MDGILVINKVSGPTSFAIVAKVRRITGEKRVGHGGTLDPLASGVLPLFLGQATRLVEYLQEYPKTYRAGIILGVSTDTFDAEGRVINSTDFNSELIAQSSRLLPSLLPSFLGTISQTPPVFSALKKNGQPLYKLARQGVAPEIEARLVTIHRIDIVDFRPPLLTLDIECSRGTYIRSLAHDLGQRMGVGAHLKSLARTAYGPFDITDSVTLEQLQPAVDSNPPHSSYSENVSSRETIERLSSFLKPLDSVLSNLPPITLTAEQERDARNGRQLSLDVVLGRRLRAYSQSGRFMAVLASDAVSSLWQPEKVFN